VFTSFNEGLSGGSERAASLVHEPLMDDP